MSSHFMEIYRVNDLATFRNNGYVPIHAISTMHII